MFRCVIALLWVLRAFGQQPSQHAVGALFLDGGSSDPAIGAAFGVLARGRDAHILVIPTGLPDTALNSLNLEALPQTAQTYFGVPKVSVLHAASRSEADSEGFSAPIRSASAVFFMGGDHTRILERYAGTRFEAELKEFHRRGGVIGGSSAGAMVIGSYQANRPGSKGGRIVDQPSNWAGFCLLTDTMIDVHFSERRRRSHIPPILKNNPRLHVIGIDERTAAIVRPTGEIEVLGRGVVTLISQDSMRVLAARRH